MSFNLALVRSRMGDVPTAEAFFAEAVRGERQQILGVIAIKLDLSALQESWQAAGERIILANADGISLLSSVPDWRYRALDTLSEEQRARISLARQFGTQSSRSKLVV